MRLIRLLKKDLAKEISTWVENELISAAQARSICQLYGVDYDSIRDHSGGYRILVSLGYLFLGLALVTLLSANWDEIPRGLRMAGLLALTVGTHGLALRSYFAPNESNGSGLFFLGNLFYGASIILIAQIYHLGEHMPDGVFWWALGSLPFGLLLKNPWLTLFSCLLGLLWFVLEYSLGFTAMLFPVFIAGALYVLFEGRSSTPLFLTAVASIVLWVEATLSTVWAGSHYGFRLYTEHLFVGTALFIFAYAISQWLHSRGNPKAKDYGALLSLWTLRFGLFVMLVLSFESPWKGLMRVRWEHLESMGVIVTLMLGASLWLGWKTSNLRTLVPIIVFFVLSTIAVILLDSPDNAIIFQIAYNIALVGSSIWLILRGIQSGISHYFFLGIATILLTAFLRYIDLIGEYIGGAILFLVFAALLLAAAKYWKTKRNVEVGS